MGRAQGWGQLGGGGDVNESTKPWGIDIGGLWECRKIVENLRKIAALGINILLLEGT